jgi:hypothetical protein
MPGNRYDFKAVAHLNNTGVCLIQRQCYHQAIETFNDAISIVKVMLCSRLTDLTSRGHAVDVQDKLRKAAMRLSTSKPSTVEFVKNISVEVLSDDESPTHFYCGKNSHSLTNGVYLVRIEPDYFDIPSKNALAIHSSTILYNYGMAYKCLSSLSTCIPRARKYNAGALHVFKTAHSALLSLDYSGEDNRRTPFHPFLLLNLLVLHHLVELTHQRGVECVQNEYSSYLGRVRYEIIKLVAVEGNFSAPAAGAA